MKKLALCVLLLASGAGGAHALTADNFERPDEPYYFATYLDWPVILNLSGRPCDKSWSPYCRPQWKAARVLMWDEEDGPDGNFQHIDAMWDVVDAEEGRRVVFCANPDDLDSCTLFKPSQFFQIKIIKRADYGAGLYGAAAWTGKSPLFNFR